MSSGNGYVSGYGLVATNACSGRRYIAKSSVLLKVSMIVTRGYRSIIEGKLRLT